MKSKAPGGNPAHRGRPRPSADQSAARPGGRTAAGGASRRGRAGGSASAEVVGGTGWWPFKVYVLPAALFLKRSGGDRGRKCRSSCVAGRRAGGVAGHWGWPGSFRGRRGGRALSGLRAVRSAAFPGAGEPPPPHPPRQRAASFPGASRLLLRFAVQRAAQGSGADECEADPEER